MLENQKTCFEVESMVIAGIEESIVKGGRDQFPLLGSAFAGIKQIGVIGWGSQGPAQSQNLKESLMGTDIKVKIGLRSGSASFEKARTAGFNEDNDTLGEMYGVIAESDMVILLISDSAQVDNMDKIFATIKAGSTLGFSHGFLLGHMKTIGRQWPKSINVVAVCPKGMGPSVRRLYIQGKELNGAGINSSIAIEQDINGKALDYALGWSIAIGSPFSFKTTLENEYKSDIFGERCILLGGVHGIIESLYRYFVAQGLGKEQAFIQSCESITGPISHTLSKSGLMGLYHTISEADQPEFQKAYNLAYLACKGLTLECYEDVASGDEISSVIRSGKRIKTYPIDEVDTTEMWQIGKTIRANRDEAANRINPFTAGIYAGAMMAQIDVLEAKKHAYSEIANESVIEAVDSLNPYMHFKGVAYMIDNCSLTARLGARKWAPRFDYAMTSCFAKPPQNSSNPFADFETHKIHSALAVCAELRPSVDIFVC